MTPQLAEALEFLRQARRELAELVAEELAHQAVELTPDE